MPKAPSAKYVREHGRLTTIREGVVSINNDTLVFREQKYVLRKDSKTYTVAGCYEWFLKNFKPDPNYLRRAHIRESSPKRLIFGKFEEQILQMFIDKDPEYVGVQHA